MRCVKIAAALALTQLGGCFVFIPGSVVGAVSDGITGSKGEHCVSRAAKVGDMIRAPDGRVFRVESLSGTSMRCTDSALPIRAEMALMPDRAATLAAVSTPLPPPPQAPTEAERATACAKMNAVKPGASQAEFQEAWAELNKLGMTWRDCPR